MRFTMVAVTCAVLAIGVGAAAAKDLNPPPWDASLPHQTAQAWECQTSSGFFNVEPTVSQNPYGFAYMNVMGGDAIQVIPGPDGQPIPTWHIGPGGGGIDIWVPNNPDENLVKRIFWQLTSDKSPTPTGSPPTTNPPGTALPAPYPQSQWPTDNWYTYNGLLEIRPNPVGEWIHFNFAESTNIEEIVIKTVCVVPEPATLSLLAVGALAVMRRRRR